MLYILIPCLLLLIVAVVLKKRESANNESSSDNGKKTANKKVSKTTTTRTSRASTTPTKVATTPVATEAAPTTLDTEVRISIENLIKAENYFAAEAKINQALNQDNSQHELYLYLLEIHVAQKDDFAIKQLINYLRSLGLHDIADQAEAKQLRAQANALTVSEAVIPAPMSTPVQPQSLKSDAAFDELISTPVRDSNTVKASFDSLQPDFNTTQAEKKDLEPIEYSFEPKKSVEAPQAVEFELNSDTVSNSVDSAPNTVEKPLEDTSKVDVAPLEFDFSAPVENKVKEEPATPVEDFVFSTPATSKETSTQPAAEFKLDNELPISPATDFHFSLDTPISADPTSLAFETQKIEIAPAFVEPEVDTSTLADSNDPLAQSFPELLKVNEIQLNLDLASRYIELGAYDAAKKLLSADENTFSTEQRDRSQQLLKQIAS